jgi:hypothetical protein
MKRLVCLSFFAVFAFYCTSFSQDSSASASTQAPTQASAAASPSFSVDSIAIAANIESRVPMGVGSEFAWDIGRVFCWIRVSSPQAPVPVKFLWYKNEEMVLEWPYSLISESGRLWGMKAVSTGKWKVEIVDGAKNVVKTANFVVKDR